MADVHVHVETQGEGLPALLILGDVSTVRSAQVDCAV